MMSGSSRSPTQPSVHPSSEVSGLELLGPGVLPLDTAPARTQTVPMGESLFPAFLVPHSTPMEEAVRGQVGKTLV